VVLNGRPELGFLGMGWIGRDRLEALRREDIAHIVAIADPDTEAVLAATQGSADAVAVTELGELLELDLDGVVIATPSAMHAPQAIATLQHGVAVFSQKPLARTRAEAAEVIAAAAAAGRPFGVDLSYRHTAAAQRMRAELQEGRIGRVFATELVFHNAYGPDKPWFVDRRRSGGGCVIDLGTHLLDLLLWLQGDLQHRVDAVTLLRGGRPLAGADAEVEDFAAVQMTTADGASVRLACSWFLPAGCNCVFDCTLHGTEGALSMSNVAGSFYDFRLDLRHGTQAETLVSGPDSWGGRAVCAWARELGGGGSFDADLGRSVEAVAGLVDAIYAHPEQAA
jgi:predicted dehydrogenase